MLNFKNFDPKKLLGKQVLIPVIMAVGSAFGVAVNPEAAQWIASLVLVAI